MSIQPLTSNPARAQLAAKRSLEFISAHTKHQVTGAVVGAGIGAGLAAMCAPFNPGGGSAKWPMAVFAVTLGLIGLAVGSADNSQAQLAELQNNNELWDSGVGR